MKGSTANQRGTCTFNSKTLGSTTFTRENILNNIKTMLEAMHPDESETRQFWFSGKGRASHPGCPLWQGLSNNVGTGGLGLYQLTLDNYRYRDTVWNWQMNVAQAAVILYCDFLWTCEHLDDHPPTISSGYVANVYPEVSQLTIDRMARLGSYSQYNGGPGAAGRYHLWSAAGPAPVFVSVTPTGWLLGTYAEQHTMTAREFNFDDLDYEPTAGDPDIGDPPVTYGICTSTWTCPDNMTLDQSTADAVDWPSVSVVTNRYVLNHTQLQIWLALFKGGTDPVASARLVDQNNGSGDAGVSPPAAHWAKRNYLPVDGYGTKGQPDLNSDGVPSVYHSDPSLYPDWAPRYADNKSE